MLGEKHRNLQLGVGQLEARVCQHLIRVSTRADVVGE
jgi:hypothetical protein